MRGTSLVSAALLCGAVVSASSCATLAGLEDSELRPDGGAIGGAGNGGSSGSAGQGGSSAGASGSGGPGGAIAAGSSGSAGAGGVSAGGAGGSVGAGGASPDGGSGGTATGTAGAGGAKVDGGGGSGGGSGAAGARVDAGPDAGCGPCSGGRQCIGGVCQCPTGQNFCAGTCIANDVNSCGSTCLKCAPPAGGTASCNAAGMCVPTCTNASLPNYCMASNACFNFANDAAHCGSCTKTCSMVATCSASVCSGKYGETVQLPNTIDIIPNNLLGMAVSLPVPVNVQKLGVIMSQAAGFVTMAVYQNDGSGTLRRQAYTAQTSLNFGVNEIAVTVPKTLSGTVFVVVEFSSQVRLYQLSSGTAQRIYASQSMVTNPPPDVFPNSAPSNGLPTNLYVVGTE